MLRLEILECRPVTLEKRESLVKMFFVIFEILELSFLCTSRKVSVVEVFGLVVGCKLSWCNLLKKNAVKCVFLDIFKVLGAASSTHLHEIISDGV